MAGKFLKETAMNVSLTEYAEIPADDIQRFIFSAPQKNSEWKKITAIRLANRDIQIEKLTEKQAFHSKISAGENIFKHEIFSLFGKDFLQLEILTSEFSFRFRAAKKRVLFQKNKLKKPLKEAPISLNRQKNYILSEGMQIQPLVDLGIFHPDFSLVKKSSSKFKQINRFVEFADELLKDKTPPEDRPFTIVDFGCGKSYLTFILYYYFTAIRRWNVRMIGMDLKKDVIDFCNATAQKYQYGNLSFQCGDIGSYAENTPIDMIVTLHACDIATDYALYHAINRNVKYILSVPCCQHELNKQFHSEELSCIEDYGLIQERFCVLLTDMIRAELLKSRNYNVQLLEFVDLSHTPKNVLIRAELRNSAQTDCRKHLANVEKIMQKYSLTPTLYKLLQK